MFQRGMVTPRMGPGYGRPGVPTPANGPQMQTYSQPPAGVQPIRPWGGPAAQSSQSVPVGPQTPVWEPTWSQGQVRPNSSIGWTPPWMPPGGLGAAQQAQQQQSQVDLANQRFLMSRGVEGGGGPATMPGGPAPEWQQARNARFNPGGVQPIQPTTPATGGLTPQQISAMMAAPVSPETLAAARAIRFGDTRMGLLGPGTTQAQGQDRLNYWKGEMAARAASQGSSLTPEQASPYMPYYNNAFQAARY